MKTKLHITLIITALLVAGCSQGIPELTETHVFDGIDFSIQYPQGWFAENQGQNSWIIEKEEDLNIRFSNNTTTEGIVIIFEHQPLSFLHSIGLPRDDLSLDTLFAFNIGELTGMTNPEIIDTEIFGVPAVRSEYYEERSGEPQEQWEISYAGLIEDKAFYLIVTAPTEETLNNFKPTWDQMLASITPLDQ